MGAALSHPVTSKHTSCSGTARMRVGSAEMQGYRIDMEDAITVQYSLASPHSKTAFFGVYDGHCGDKCSAWLASEMPKRVGELLDPWDDTLLADCVVKADRDFLATEEKTNGSTCVFSLVREKGPGEWEVKTANVGDSRALVIRKDGSFEALTDDHKPENPKEHQRIVEAGGSVSQNRVDGELAMSRSMGDCKYKENPSLPQVKQKVIPLPDISTVTCRDGDFLLVCCDGIFERMENPDVAAFTFEELQSFPDDPCAVIRALLEQSLTAGSKDNMSGILICFGKDGTKYKDTVDRGFYAGPFSHGKDDQQFVEAYMNDAKKKGLDGEKLAVLYREADKTYVAPPANQNFMQSAALTELIRAAGSGDPASLGALASLFGKPAADEEEDRPARKRVEDQSAAYGACAAGCGKRETSKSRFMVCGGCMKESYCSKECQRAHWKETHKKTCKPGAF